MGSLPFLTFNMKKCYGIIFIKYWLQGLECSPMVKYMLIHRNACPKYWLFKLKLFRNLNYIWCTFSYTVFINYLIIHKWWSHSFSNLYKWWIHFLLSGFLISDWNCFCYLTVGLYFYGNSLKPVLEGSFKEDLHLFLPDAHGY